MSDFEILKDSLVSRESFLVGYNESMYSFLHKGMIVTLMLKKNGMYDICVPILHSPMYGNSICLTPECYKGFGVNLNWVLEWIKKPIKIKFNVETRSDLFAYAKEKDLNILQFDNNRIKTRRKWIPL
jgi:hypothetical protein